MAPRIDTLQAAVRKAGFDTRRSDLWRYMREKRGWFTQMREDGATWPAIGAAVRELGIKDRDGKLPTDETVRQTWKKIEKEPKPRVRKPPQARPALPGEILPAEPEPQKRKFRRGATFRGTEE
jgi:hypothetical protein